MSIAASVRSARDLVKDSELPETVFISPALYTFLTTPEHNVTNGVANSTPDTAVRVIAEHLYGLEPGWDKNWGGNHSPPSTEGSNTGKGEGVKHGIKGLLDRLHIRKGKAKGKDGDDDGPSAKAAEDDDDEKNEAEDQWTRITPLDKDQLDEVKRCGRWENPSELFLNIYGQVLLTLEKNPLNGLVSPPLLGSSGVIPMTIVSVIPDIVQYHAELIVRAEHEIFLATNFWEASNSAGKIVDAFKELSRRVIERKGEKVVIKLMYDRGNLHQIINPHQPVEVKEYTDNRVKLPTSEEIPGCLLEVQNYHVPPVGTFHSKYMIVDRKIAILNSNNIQDRVNVEMMIHLEGPIVQSLYDTALLSWWSTFNPSLPLINQHPAYSADSTYSFGQDHPVIAAQGDIKSNADHTRQTLRDQNDATATWDIDHVAEAETVGDTVASAPEKINKHLNTGAKINPTDTSPPPNTAKFKPIFLHSEHKPVPMALVNRSPRGRPGHGDTFVPQDQAWLAALRFAKENVFIQTPTFNAKPIVAATLDAVRRGILVEIYADLGFNDEGELLPFQGGTNEMVAAHMYSVLTEEQKDKLRIYWYTGKDQKTPLNARDKSRNCHVKLMIVDGHIGIQGNGNQDSQSWYHSQEINVLIDSELICTEWREAIDSNQNTLFYGRVDPKDGVWRDEESNTLPGQKDPPHGPLKSLVGVKGAVQRVRGEGGF